MSTLFDFGSNLALTSYGSQGSVVSIASGANAYIGIAASTGSGAPSVTVGSGTVIELTPNGAIRYFFFVLMPGSTLAGAGANINWTYAIFSTVSVNTV